MASIRPDEILLSFDSSTFTHSMHKSWVMCDCTLNIVQVWTILDMHNPYICSSFNWHFCDIYSTQTEEERMGLWYQSGYMVCRCILWLCHHCSSCTLCNSQVLLSSIRSCSVTLSLWLLPVCLHSSIGKFFFPSFQLLTMCWIIFSLKLILSMFEILLCVCSVSLLFP